MKAPGLPADQQFFADLFSGLVLNPQLLGRVWFASQPASLPVGSLCIDFPRLDIVAARRIRQPAGSKAAANGGRRNAVYSGTRG